MYLRLICGIFSHSYHPVLSCAQNGGDKEGQGVDILLQHCPSPPHCCHCRGPLCPHGHHSNVVLVENMSSHVYATFSCLEDW